MPNSIELLEKSLNQVKNQGDEFSASFYGKLFILCPHIKSMFARLDSKEQEKKLMQALVLIVYNVRRPGALDYMLKELGFRHIQYGARSNHYKMFAKILVQTMAEYLGENWTSEMEASWIAACELIAAKMAANTQEVSPEPVKQSTSEKSKESVDAQMIPAKVATKNDYLKPTLNLDSKNNYHDSKEIHKEVLAESVGSVNNLRVLSKDLKNREEKEPVISKIASQESKPTNYKITVGASSSNIEPKTGLILAGGGLSLMFFILLILRPH